MSAQRERLPNRRASSLASFEHDGVKYRAEWSRYPDGRLAEFFLDAGKPGQPIDIMSRDAAVVLSIALQHGVPIAAIKDALSQEKDGTMRGPIGVLLAMAEAERLVVVGRAGK